MTADQERDLRSQHRAYTRQGYDGHNRKAQAVRMRDLAQRRTRRQSNRVRREIVAELGKR